MEGFWRSRQGTQHVQMQEGVVSVVIRGTTVFKSDWHTGYQERKSKMIEQGLGLQRSGEQVLGGAQRRQR